MMWETEPLTWNDEHERTLRRVTVDENGPGTILRDFTAVLDFCRERALPVSKVQQVPTLKVLRQFNALVSHPIEVRLKRPRFTSFPHLQGLYLLLRATGLGQISGRKPMLEIDSTLLDVWSALNPTERYFALLEAWLLRGDPEIVGGRGGFMRSPVHQFSDASTLLSLAGSEEGLSLDGHPRIGLFWKYSPGPMGMALLELFGMLSVVTLPPQDGEGWVVERIYRTLLGEAVFARLYTDVLGSPERVVALEYVRQSSCGLLQPMYAPYLPQLQHSLEPPSLAFREGRYTFKVSLAADLWRRIRIDAHASLDELASTILDAYEFDHDHLYEFTYRNSFGVKESVQHPYLDEEPSTAEVRIGDVPLAVGTAMTFVFDFGDWWEFEVKLEQIETSKEIPAETAIVKQTGASPEQYPEWEDEDI